MKDHRFFHILLILVFLILVILFSPYADRQEPEIETPPVVIAPTQEIPAPVEQIVEQTEALNVQKMVKPEYTPQEEQIPSRKALAPTEAHFRANRIFVPEVQLIEYIPLWTERVRTFSGRFGPYDFDPRPFIYVNLCSSEINGAMRACDQPSLGFRDGYVDFSLGYSEVEYIGGVAREQFLAQYFVMSPTYGILAESNQGRFEFVQR